MDSFSRYKELLLHNFCFDAQGFEVILKTSNNSDKTIRIFFENSVDSSRRTDESYVGGIVGPMADKYGREFAQWPFFKIENSEYLKWFFDTSIGMAQIRGWKFTHFSIMALDSMLDIIAPQSR